MSHAFGTTPPEPPMVTSTDALAPGMARAVEGLMGKLADVGHPVRIRESYRTPARVEWLFGIGREYDPDGRGIVTNVRTGEKGWHPYGMGTDFEDLHGREVNDATVAAIEQHAPEFGLVSGATWVHVDRPHVQPAACPKSPTAEDQADYLAGNVDAVVARYGMDQ